MQTRDRCASKCTHVAQREDNGSRCGLSIGEANEVNGRPSPSPRNHGVSESSSPPSFLLLPPLSLPPHHSRPEFSCRCMRDAVPARRSCSSPSLPLFLSSPSPDLCVELLPLRSSRRCSPRCNGLLVSLSSSLSRSLSLSLSRFPFLPPCRSLFLLRSRLFSFSLVRLRIRIQRKSATPLPRVRPSCFVFQRLFLLRSPLSAPPPASRYRRRRDVHRGPLPLYAYFIALLALHFHPRVHSGCLRAASCGSIAVEGQ